MDNGLIFPYPWLCAHAEPADTNITKPAGRLRVLVGGCGGPEVVVGKRWGDAGG